MLAVLRSLPDRYGRPAANGSYLAALDGLRALAIAIVVFWHIGVRVFRLTLTGEFDTSDNVGFLASIPHGEVGVSLFFFISGFMIIRPFVQSGRAMSSQDAMLFYSRRILRIAPPHLIVVAIVFLALAVVGYKPVHAVSFDVASQSLGASLVASVFYANGLVFQTPPRLNPPTWSLEIEMQFYLIFPVLLALQLAFWRRYRSIIARAALPVGSALVALLIYAVAGNFSPFRWIVVSYLYLFLLGALVAELSQTARPIVRSTRWDLAFLGGLALLLLTGLFRDQRADFTEALRLFAAMAAVLMLYSGVSRGRLANALACNKWVTLIGAMSYSIYLTHIIVIQAFATILFRYVQLGNDLANIALAVAVLAPIVFVVGAGYYIAVERVFMRARPRPNLQLRAAG